jgi:hypothetical protein
MTAMSALGASRQWRCQTCAQSNVAGQGKILQSYKVMQTEDGHGE